MLNPDGKLPALASQEREFFPAFKELPSGSVQKLRFSAQLSQFAVVFLARKLLLIKETGNAVDSIMKIETKFILAAVVVLLTMLFVAAIPIKTGIAMHASEREFAQSLEKEQQFGRLLNILRDAETGQRGYVITGKENFLYRYHVAKDEIPPLRVSLLALAADDNSAQLALADIFRVADLKLDELAETVELRRSKGFSEAEVIVSSERGKKYMDELRNLIGQQISVQQTRRVALQRQLDKDSDQAIYVGSAATAFNLAVLTILLALMFRLLKGRATQVLELDKSAAALKASACESDERNRQMALSAEMLQALGAVASLDETSRIIAAYCPKLLPGVNGVLYLYRNSRDLLEAQASWGNVVCYLPEFEPNDCWALKRGQSHSTCDSQDLHCKHYDGHAQTGLHHLCTPLIAQGEVIGVLYLECDAEDRRIIEQQQLIARTAEQIALALSNVMLRESLHRQSIVDPLTGLFNRRYLDETLRRELIRAERKKTSLCLIMLDLDHFKHLNDTFGHEAGDVALKSVAQTLRNHTRECDLACRFGGEELIVVLPECELSAALERAEKIRIAIEELDVRYAGGTIGTVTASLGVAAFPGNGRDAAALIHAADHALYRAKHMGRNRSAEASLN